MKRFRVILLLVLLAGLTAAYVLGGAPALIGMTYGYLGTTFSLWALWKMIGLASYLVTPPEPGGMGRTTPVRGTVLVVTAFFIKLPVFAVFALAAQRLGEAALNGFAGGILLVYSALVGWVLSKQPDPF